MLTLLSKQNHFPTKSLFQRASVRYYSSLVYILPISLFFPSFFPGCLHLIPTLLPEAATAGKVVWLMSPELIHKTHTDADVPLMQPNTWNIIHEYKARFTRMHKGIHKPVKNGLLHMLTYFIHSCIDRFSHTRTDMRTCGGPEWVGRDGGVQGVLLHLLSLPFINH